MKMIAQAEEARPARSAPGLVYSSPTRGTLVRGYDHHNNSDCNIVNSGRYCDAGSPHNMRVNFSRRLGIALFAYFRFHSDDCTFLGTNYIHHTA